MPKLSPAREAVPLLPGLQLLNRGKVRDTYRLDDEHLLLLASDGVSIFDVVLNALVPQKGQVLAALSHFWLTFLGDQGIHTHLVAAGADIDTFLPQSLRNNPEVQSRSMTVKRLGMLPVEFIARGYLTGSAFAAYAESREVGDHLLPPGLQDGDKLPRVLDTPTTKAQEGHDQSLSASRIRALYPDETYWLMAAYQLISAFAEKRGIVFADTKLEFGRKADGEAFIADEAGTPDSSRYWDKLAWLESRKPDSSRKAPPALDKQLARIWGKAHGVEKVRPENEADVSEAHQLIVPDSLIRALTQTYRYILWRLTDFTLEGYFRQLGVTLNIPKKRVVFLLGSESDIPALRAALDNYHPTANGQIGGTVGHVISCHRNPNDLENFVVGGCDRADVVIAAGGKAFALPGILDALLHKENLDIPVLGVALGSPGTRAFDAAKLSIEELPGQPVVMNELTGEAYSGVEGFKEAIARVNSGELPPPQPRADKPAQFNADVFSQSALP